MHGWEVTRVPSRLGPAHLSLPPGASPGGLQRVGPGPSRGGAASSRVGVGTAGGAAPGSGPAKAPLWPLPRVSGSRVAMPRAAVWEDSFSVSATLRCNSQAGRLTRFKFKGLGLFRAQHVSQDILVTPKEASPVSRHPCRPPAWQPRTAFCLHGFAHSGRPVGPAAPPSGVLEVHPAGASGRHPLRAGGRAPWSSVTVDGRRCHV